MAAPIRVVDEAGNFYLVDPALLTDANAPVAENTIQPTADAQLYQLVLGDWYRVLRTDKVSWMTDIKPHVGTRRPQQLPFALGQAAEYIE